MVMVELLHLLFPLLDPESKSQSLVTRGIEDNSQIIVFIFQ